MSIRGISSALMHRPGTRRSVGNSRENAAQRGYPMQKVSEKLIAVPEPEAPKAPVLVVPPASMTNTKAELLHIADEMGLMVKDSMTKREILAAIQAI